MGTRRPAARLKDVAELAGVSIKTVSNVVHDYPYVRADTRTRVQAAIEQLGYLPNMSARNLRSGRTGVIALAVPELDAPYFSELAHHVVQAAVRRSWTVLVDETQGVPERERQAAAGIRGRLLDGAILSPLALDEADVERDSSSIPLVLLGERVRVGPADHVVIDNRAAAAEMTRHLLTTGRRRIAVIGAQGPPYGHTARVRIEGYSAAMSEAGLEYDEALVIEARDWRRVPGMAATQQLLALDHLPEAIFCLNDLLALGAMRALADAGVRVPDDIAVAGFDDIEESRFCTPTLTTIAPDKEAIAEHAVARLERRLGDGDSPAEEVVVDYTLQVRESTAAC